MLNTSGYMGNRASRRRQAKYGNHYAENANRVKQLIAHENDKKSSKFARMARIAKKLAKKSYV